MQANESVVYHLEQLASHDAASTEGRWQYLDDKESGAAKSFNLASDKALAAETPGQYNYEATYWAGYALRALEDEDMANDDNQFNRELAETFNDPDVIAQIRQEKENEDGCKG